MEKGKGKWVRIFVHIRVAACLNETKKGGETRFFEFKKGEYRDGQHA